MKITGFHHGRFARNRRLVTVARSRARHGRTAILAIKDYEGANVETLVLGGDQIVSEIEISVLPADRAAMGVDERAGRRRQVLRQWQAKPGAETAGDTAAVGCVDHDDIVAGKPQSGGGHGGT